MALDESEILKLRIKKIMISGDCGVERRHILVEMKEEFKIDFGLKKV
jgi:hypothetical protein